MQEENPKYEQSSLLCAALQAGWSMMLKCDHALGPVEIQDSHLGLIVIQALDGSICTD
jgi:hypothetical protein